MQLYVRQSGTIYFFLLLNYKAMIDLSRNIFRVTDLKKSVRTTNYLLLLALLLPAFHVSAQQASLNCNKITNWVQGTLVQPSVDAPTPSGYNSQSKWENTGNITDTDTDNFGTLTLVSNRRGIGCVTTTDAAGSIRIYSSENYTLGNFVGIITDKDPTAEFSSVTIRAMNGTTAIGSSESTPVVSSLNNGTYMVGFKTTGSGSFNGVRLSFKLDAPVFLEGCETRTRTLGIKNAFQVKYCPTEQTACNLTVKANLPDRDVSVTSSGGLQVNTPLGTISYGANDIENVISASGTDYGTISFYVASLIPAWIQVKDQSVYPKGTFAGFEIENNDIINVSLLGDITITTYLNGVQKEAKSAADLVVSGGVLQSSGKKTLGFITDHNDGFNEVRITISGAQLGASSTHVYNAVFRRLCEAESLVCNTPVRITSSNYPVAINMVNTGVDGVFGINNKVVGADNILDENATLPAEIILPANLLATGKIAIKKGLSNYPAGAFVGFDISRPVLADIGLLQGLKIKTFLNGIPTTDEVSESGLLALNTSVLSGTARRIVGFIPTKPFDEIQLIVEQAVNVTLGSTRVHSFLIQKFCGSQTNLACNNPTPVYIPANPVYINARHTGVDAIACADCKIDDTQAVIDNNASTYAEVILTAGLAVDASVSVANALEDYPVNSFVGFEIGTATLLSANILSSIEIKLYKDGNPTPVKTVSSAGLILSATSSILDGTFNRQLIGIVSDKVFDEAQIVFKQPVSLNLGTIRIYQAVVTGSCPSPAITCNSSQYLTQTAFPVYINPARTGTSGIADVSLGGVKNAWNVVSSSTSDHALMGFAANAGVGAQTSISVVDALNVYPSGTVAGFTVKVSPSLVGLNLLSALKIRTYLNGNPAGTSGNGDLIDLELLGIPIFGSGSGTYNVGFVSSQPFNEIQITASALAGVELFQAIEVYGAFVDTRTATKDGTLTCITTNPDINVAYINKTVTGNVSTNDYVGNGQTVTYGTPVPGSNPPNGVINMSGNGSYTFLATVPGVYTFEIPVCPGNQTTGCPTETLTITVLDPTKSNNPPVANADMVNMTGTLTGTATPVLIDVTANDKPGNVGGTLTGLSKGGTNPSNGTVDIVDGKVKYTPALGFYGKDVFTYKICETPSTQCREAEVVVNVLPPGTSAVIASDDYNRTTVGTQLSAPAAGVLINDRDAAGGTITVTTTNVSNDAGAVLFSSDGSYVYTPNSSFTGTGVFPYEARNEAGITARATLYLSVYDPGALPVKLSEFVVSKEAGAAHLSWATALEQNSERFEVERSIEGKTWHRLGTIPASGSSNIVRRYTYVDASPAEGINYYRLKMVDKGGSFEHSPVRSVSFELTSEITITPNPASENLRLKVRDAGSVEKVELISATGQVLYRSGTSPLADINVRHLPAGMYILNITRTGGRISTHKVLKN